MSNASKNLTEWLIATVNHTLADDGEQYLTFGPILAPTLEDADNVASSSSNFLGKTYGGIQRALLGNKREFR